MQQLRTLLLFVLFFVFAFLFAAEDSTEAKLFHNDGWFIHEQYRASHAEFERTVTEMKSLQADTKAPEFGRAAKLIGELDKRYTVSHDITQKMVAFYKQKWNQKHYQSAEKDWKDSTYKKHKEKLTAVHLLMQHLQAAYNDWNAQRDKAAATKDRAKVLSLFTEADDALEKALKEEASEEKTTFSELESELSAIKNIH